MGQSAINVANCINCLIENNVITQNQSVGGSVIEARTRPNADDAEMSNVIIRNNTITIANDNTKTGVRVWNEGSGHEITDNTVNHTGSGSFTCVSPATTTADVTVSDNICP